ncbi:phytanoyl-CoA dioxygenase family protein [Agarivorans sp. Alg241-V36]|uniref:phytanoyl-CoA dioxygenase family protein n=1 Tax=Agarivorans sp. Alg241-V36 TaxID=2305992 RepID=UPI0013D237AE|nr:phytanoyl-CoA dioxygenase family protein [Agarivorans sp. Alg241-V36]
MIDKNLQERFNQEGMVLIPSVFSDTEVAALKTELLAATLEDYTDPVKHFDKGMVHNCMLRGRHMLALLDNPKVYNCVTTLLDPCAIIYAYQASTLMAKSSNYGTRVHVDCPRFIPNYMTNLGLILPLDDFTLDNGATYYLPGSHLSENIPSEDNFYQQAQRAVCRKGDLILFNARLVHAAGANDTEQERCALTINFCRSYMRQRFDFPRLMPTELIDTLGDRGKQLIGMNVRMPSSLEEFYLPEEQRLYRANQG